MIFLDANGDVTKQNNDIQDLISRRVKILLLNPVNPQAVAPSIEAAKAAGIPVTTVDRPVEKGAVTHIGRDNNGNMCTPPAATSRRPDFPAFPHAGLSLWLL